jgi:hypothetical protein
MGEEIEMKMLIELLQLNQAIIQTAAFIWMVFEVRLLRHKFEEHLQNYHRRATDKAPESTGDYVA